MLHICVLPQKVDNVLRQCHDGVAGGHLDPEATTRKVRIAEIWWPILNKDTTNYVKECNVCQRLFKPQKMDHMELHHVLAQAPFKKWGLDYVGPIKPASHETQARYIVVATNDFTKWVEARVVRHANSTITTRFIFGKIICLFGCPLEIVTNWGTHFINEMIIELLGRFMIIHRKSTPYYPKCNGQVERTSHV